MKYKYITGAKENASVSEMEKEHRSIAKRVAQEGIVLLKNDGALPIKDKKIALYGAGVKHTVKGGSGSGEVNERYSVNIYDGLVSAGFEITSEKWLFDYEKEFSEKYNAYTKERCAEAKKCGMNIEGLMAVGDVPFMYPAGREININDVEEIECDTAIYVISRQAGECVDRSQADFTVTDSEAEHLKFLSSQYKKTVLVINSGSYVTLSKIRGFDISAIIYFCQQGCEGGSALADILMGSVSPSGKLTDTWIKDYSDIPFGNEFSSDIKEVYKEGIYVGYRYFDSFDKEPEYPFGYGLSYTNFEISTLGTRVEKDIVILDVEVRNTGEYCGKEVVQAYVSLPRSEIHKEYQRLVAFGKSRELMPGESERITLSFSLEYCKSYSEKDACEFLDKGDYIIRVGNHSRNTGVSSVISIDKPLVIKKLKNVCNPNVSIPEFVSKAELGFQIPDGIERISINADNFKSETIEYKRSEQYHDDRVDAIMDKLSVSDMIDLVVGIGALGLFRISHIAALGTIGSTTSKLYKKGLVNVNLSDGPAGIRLLRTSSVRGRWLKMVDLMMDFFKYFPKPLLKFLSANPKKDKPLYQYCTAFPVGTAMAQTFNEKLAEEVGRAISCEMNEYLVTYWLAPAMNIHRNPLGGRNYEYYSEDPVLSGKIGAAMVRGVQSYNGNYATIKHFACNNREKDRKISDSILSERTLREIYLRGFEICVKESSPKAVMTSYNLVNGIYTPNSYDLINEILRCEWGFSGIVMSDWNSTEKGFADTAMAISVGNDMIMQGGAYYKKEIRRAVRKGDLSKKELQIAAANIVKQILYSTVSKTYKAKDFL